MFHAVLGAGEDYETDSETVWYRDYKIVPHLFPGPHDRFIYSHRDYQGAGDNRCGSAETIEQCKKEIDELNS
jgi:hypothetical protein